MPQNMLSGKALIVCGSLLGALGSLPGCASDGPDTSGTTHDDRTAIRTAMSDGEYAALMAQHHDGGIEMSRYEARNGARRDVGELAREMADAQTAEHTKLEAIAREGPTVRHEPDLAMERRSARDMKDLRAASGAEVDRVFLDRMMDHHARGVDMTRRSLPNLSSDSLRRMAQHMIDDQTRELDQMRGMLNQ
jgi:uncharacterized protein (DUF305 family)